MKFRLLTFTCSVVLASTLAFTTKPLSDGPSANGQGSYTIGGNQQRRFAFHSSTMPDGSVQGSGELTYTGGVLKVKFNINCMKVTGKTAIISGTVTEVEGEVGVKAGWNCWFKVIDNGEGNKASPDQITLLQCAPNLGNCNASYNLAIYPIEGGNIQVK